MPQHQDHSWGDVARRLRRSRQLATGARRAGIRPPEIRHASDPRPEDVRTTLDATIRPTGSGRYRRLDWSDGEPHLLRDDLGGRPSEDRAGSRRSLLYVAQHTDVHICDAQSPARLEGGEVFGWVNPGSDGGHRPQETCTTHVFDQLVAATNAVAESPVSGTRMAWCVQTGDNTDNRTEAEVRWWIDILDGRPVTPNTGDPARYEGVQRSGWRDAWHPDRAGWGRRGRAGFPHLPGFLEAAIAPFTPVGLEVPWLAVFGNHDQIFQGTFGPARHGGLRIDRLGPMLAGTGLKPVGPSGLVRAIVHASTVGADQARWERAAAHGPGIRRVTPDPEARRPLPVEEYLAALLASAEATGDPTGHGFTAAHLADATTWWSRPEGEHVQVIGLDTCNHTAGDGGGIGPAQAAWLEAELEACHSRWRDRSGRWVTGSGADRLVILMSHHTTWTLTNRTDDEADPGPRLLGADMIEMLDRFPNVILWVNGHSHEHKVVSHRRSGGEGGWWELNTASAIDFGQQGRTVEVFANGDGTVSVLATVLDHAAAPRVSYRRDPSWSSHDLASVSRELALNDDLWINPIELLGGPEDRNVELVVPEPFPLPS